MKKIKKRQILALFVTIFFLALIFYKIDWPKLLETFGLFNLKSLIYIVPIYIITLYLRGIRWKTLLLEDKKYSAIHLGEVFTVGSWLNIFLPARAGDIYRAYYLGQLKEESKMKIFGSIILERTLDGICVFLILLFAVLFYFKQPWILNLTYLIGGIFIGSFIIMYLVFKFNKINWIADKIILFLQKFMGKYADKSVVVIEKIAAYMNSFIDGVEVLNDLKLSVWAFVMSVIIWGIECVVAVMIINAFNLNLGIAAGFFVISLISFSTMLPSTSVFLGPYQYAYILALSIFNIDKSTALAVSTVHQAILLVILTILGASFMLKFNIKPKSSL